MSPSTVIEQPDPRLATWLASHGIEFEIHPHDPAYTARDTARAEGVDPHTFAKVVGLAGPHGNVMVVLDATDQLAIHKVKELLGGDARLLTEGELSDLAPDWEVGAMPAIGPLFGLATYADYAVRDDPEISFNAGSHRLSARVDRSAWEQACEVTYADLAADPDGRPAWARS
jgi:Ala-tRNA(Pro) deacylase